MNVFQPSLGGSGTVNKSNQDHRQFCQNDAIALAMQEDDRMVIRGTGAPEPTVSVAENFPNGTPLTMGGGSQERDGQEVWDDSNKGSLGLASSPPSAGDDRHPSIALIQPSFEKHSLDSTYSDFSSSRKHPRESDASSVLEVPAAHRRIDSTGTREIVSTTRQKSLHTRQGSGLDFLASIIDVNNKKDKVVKIDHAPLRAAHDHHHRREASTSLADRNIGSYQPKMQPPAQRRVSYHASVMAAPSHPHVPPDARMMAHYPMQPYRMMYHPSQAPPHFSTPVFHPDYEMERPPASAEEHHHAYYVSYAPRQQEANTQTHTTALDDRGKDLKNAATNTEVGEELQASHPSHRKQMSSLNSFGVLMEPSVFPPTPSSSRKKSQQQHHRATSSISLFGELAGLDDGNFLNFPLAGLAGFSTNGRLNTLSPTPPSSNQVLGENRSTILDEIPDQDVAAVGERQSRLPTGGTSKRVRRKCHVEGCENRVVQGGRCIAHGAKRKTCKYPGCDKNVKKAGLCSAHGPARKRCEEPGCEKVAVKGGLCIAHGAKKPCCSVSKCEKQAVLSGMCKKHFDGAQNRKIPSESVSKDEKKHAPVHKPHHTRGLSIFTEIKADDLRDILNDSTA